MYNEADCVTSRGLEIDLEFVVDRIDKRAQEEALRARARSPGGRAHLPLPQFRWRVTRSISRSVAAAAKHACDMRLRGSRGEGFACSQASWHWGWATWPSA